MRGTIIFLTSFILALALIGSNATYGGTIWEGRVSSDSDDCEEDVNGGGIDLNSSDLEMPYENTGQGSPQVVGVRFVDIPIPKGAIIDRAFVEFTCDETKGGSEPVSLVIEGELNTNIPAAFYEKFPDKRNIPVAYGISGAITRIINVSFNIGTRHSINIPAGAWLMGVGRLSSEALILPDDSDPAASRVRGRTMETALNGTEWEDLD